MALKRVRPELPMARGKARQIDNEYKRHGLVNLLACFDVRTGQVFGEICAVRCGAASSPSAGPSLAIEHHCCVKMVIWGV